METDLFTGSQEPKTYTQQLPLPQAKAHEITAARQRQLAKRKEQNRKRRKQAKKAQRKNR